jgi:hypothetical protein
VLVTPNKALHLNFVIGNIDKCEIL